MKRQAPNWESRMRRAAVPAGKSFAAGVGVVGTAFGIASSVGVVVPVALLLAAGGLCSLVSATVFISKSRSKHLPDVIVDDDNPDESYRARYCSPADLKEANSWTKSYYRHEYVDDPTVESWRAVSPHSFLGLHNKRDVLCAAFGIVGIDPSFMKQFLKGRVRDTALKSDDLLDDSASKKTAQLYISGVVVRDPDTVIGHRRACAMVWAMAKFYERNYGVRRKRTLFALAVSQQSKNLLVKSGFIHFHGPTDREDQLELYSMLMTKEKLQQLKLRIGDHSSLCELKLS